MALQRTVGNAAVTRMLATGDRTTPEPGVPIVGNPVASLVDAGHRSARDVAARAETEAAGGEAPAASTAGDAEVMAAMAANAGEPRARENEAAAASNGAAVATAPPARPDDPLAAGTPAAPMTAPAAAAPADAAPSPAPAAAGPVAGEGPSPAAPATLGAGAGVRDSGDASAAGEAEEGPSDEDLAALEEELEREESAPEPDGDGPDGPVLARAAIAHVPEQEPVTDEEPVDAAAVAAEAQSDIEALGASGGDDTAVAAGGGGGGGAPVEEKPERPAPDVANADPEHAVSAAASLEPSQMLQALGGAEQAAGAHATKEERKLAASPPAATTGGPGGPSADERFPGSSEKTPSPTKRAAAKSGGEPKDPAKAPPPRPRAPQSVAPAPAVQGNAKGNVTKGDAARVQASIANMPVTDPGANIPGAGTAPRVALTGAADPGQMAEQRAHLDETVDEATAQGRAEAAEPAGEDALAPTVGRERMQAEVPPAADSAGTSDGAPGGDEDRAASVVAEEQSGHALRAAAQAAAGDIAAYKQQHAAKTAQQRAAAQQEISTAEAEGHAEQIAERAAAKAGVRQARSEWTGEQRKAAGAARAEAAGAVTQAQGHIRAERAKADAEAVKHVEAGRKEAEQAKREGEREAVQEREKAKQESSGGGLLGWAKSKVTALYDKVRDGVTKIFNRVRQAITTAINKARELATTVIKNAVKFVADKIKAVASKLVAIGDRLIPGFKALRERFKTWIVNRVRQAVAALNRIVTAVKNGIKRTLQAVGKALSAAVGWLKKGMQAAIKTVKNVVKAAIEKAKAAIAALGTFAVLVKDVAANPGQWLRNLGAAIQDGIRNHLWKALKTAIQQWFNQKVESLLGLGKAVWNLLRKGGLGMAQVGKMAWEAIKAAIPPALIMILVERLVSMIVPAAGAVMAIIQGLSAAWGAIREILAAIGRFIAFLKAVRSGNAGPAFASALAAAAVAVIEFVSEFLLQKIGGAAEKVSGKIRAIAQKIGARLKGVVQKVKRGAQRARNAFKRGTRKLRDKAFGKKTPAQRKRDADRKRKAQEDRLRKAERAIRAALERGVTGRRLRAWLAGIKLRYRLSAASVSMEGERAQIHAKINPEINLWADKVPIVDKTDADADPAAEKQALTSYFRAMSLKELRNIARGQQLHIRVKQTREGEVARGGEWCLTTNPEYARRLADKERPQPNPEKLDYSVLVEIETEGPVVGEIASTPEHGRVQYQAEPGGEAPPPDPQGRPHQRSGERGVIVVKREGVRGGDAENINYMVLSKVPSDPNDPIYKINARVKRISVIGGVAGLTAAMLPTDDE